ncbi:MAG: hypothetical protein ABS62_06680 [Microbacterium sp. SCN 70-200]|uniref:hypothetical protein n=1 Tax=unclassified Microbacterium TaxID=2609290 RepID=UPI000868A03C|nr:MULTISPECIES: hypothetical protein [unclassified Microbacterium]MBN9214632.1 hypothetical protein [Microbacterium sp.]ODT41517.1 MAG: hypothetical protein ABS62_06680 [Microbacterium sp. SCN 70-200]OJV84001.1 MAG: hypothetical protein BGO46_13675 [Microbacterium sp. 70-16]
MRNTRASAIAAVAALCGLLLTACATSAAPGTAGAPALPDVVSGLPDGEVLAQGTVMDAGGELELCLGAIMESYPPQCHGIPLVGWSWGGVEGSEQEGDIRWGAYAVQGTYDGTSFTVTQPPIMLALFDPAMRDDPTGGVPGPADEATLTATQDDLNTQLGDRVLSSWPQDGRVWVQVVWDDGMLQDAADARYGDDVVLVQSALQLVSAP